MGHRQQIKFGEIKMVVAEVEQYISSRSVGTFTNITFEENYSYTLTEQITASASVKYGIIDMVSATINLEDVGSVGTSTSNTREYSFGLEVMYGKTLQKAYKINSNINIESIPSDKKTFSVSRVSCYLECEVKYSYTQEQNMFGKWKTIGGTTKSNYTCRYYIADVTTFCYNDNTFGDTSMGIYKLDLVKEY